MHKKFLIINILSGMIESLKTLSRLLLYGEVIAFTVHD
jgi:hypothetical protein